MYFDNSFTVWIHFYRMLTIINALKQNRNYTNCKILNLATNILHNHGHTRPQDSLIGWLSRGCEEYSGQS